MSLYLWISWGTSTAHPQVGGVGMDQMGTKLLCSSEEAPVSTSLHDELQLLVPKWSTLRGDDPTLTAAASEQSKDDWCYEYCPGRTEQGALYKRAMQGSYWGCQADSAITNQPDGGPTSQRSENKTTWKERLKICPKYQNLTYHFSEFDDLPHEH